jgi:hypothetical protein
MRQVNGDNKLVQTRQRIWHDDSTYMDEFLLGTLLLKLQDTTLANLPFPFLF